MKRIVSIIALTLVMVIALTSCSVINHVKDFVTGIINPSVELTDEALNAETLIDFAEGANPDVLFESDGWSNGDVFNVVWKKHNVHYENGIMRLGITEEKATAWIDDAEVEYDYTAGEARTQNYYHYGDYEVSMKPSANLGTASTFFVCTGPYDLKDGVPNAHDEIDIEFLGNDTTHVQFNFFVNGVGGNEYMYDLGFDASEEFHTYGFRWEENAITWFVDGAPVYKVTTDSSVKTGGNLKVVEKLPSTAGRILTNYWCGNERAWGWMGTYVGDSKDHGTEYQWIKTSAEGAPLNPPVDTPPVEGGDEIDWSAIEPIAPTFATTPEYIVAIDGNKANVTYTDVSGSAYKPVEMDVTEAVAGKNFVSMKVTNNGTEMVQVRVNMYDPTLTGNNTATNISATMNGTAVFTDTAWGGSFFEIPAGESAELVVNFGVGGIKLQLMIDSSRNDSTLRSGDVTIEDIKFAAVGEVVAPHKCEDADNDGKCDGCGEDMPLPPPPAPEDPTSGNLSTTIGGTTVELGGNVTDGYGVHGNEDGSIRVEYTNISTNTYENVWANIAQVAAGKSEVSLKIKNNGEATAYITVKIEAAGAVALMEGKMEIPAGEEKTYNGTFTGVAEKLYFFIDSGWSTENTTHAGEVIISDIAFAGEGEIPHSCKDADGDYICDECGHGMIVPPEEEPKVEYTDLYVEFKTDNAYNLTTPDTYANNVRVAYTDMAQNSWANINIWVADKSADCSVFSMKLTNHGAATVSVWVQMKDAAGAELINQNVDIAAGAEQVVYFEYTGTAQMIFFFVDSTHEADAELNTGDITISELKLGKVAASEEPKPVEGEYLSFKGNECYTLSATEDQYVNSIGITYSAVSDNTYQNVNTWIQDKAAGKSSVGVTIKNNGTETVNITVKLENSAGGAAETKVTLAAGESANVSLAYDFAPDLLYFFVDSGWAEVTATHAGDVTISGIHFN